MGFVIEGGPFGPRMVVTGRWSDGHATYLREHRVQDLYLNYARGWKGSDLAFLKELPWLKAFSIIDWNIGDVSPIHALERLQMLEVSTYCRTELRLDAFSSLSDCRITWRDKAQSLFKSKSVIRLFVSSYGERRADEFGKMRQLESLSIAGGALENVEGLRPLDRLTFLGLYNLGRLRSLVGLEALRKLEVLEVNDCRDLSDIDAIASLRNLRRLELNDDGRIESIRAIQKLRELREFHFFGTTNVEDGDLSPLAALPQLERTSFQERPHYNRRREDVVRSA